MYRKVDGQSKKGKPITEKKPTPTCYKRVGVGLTVHLRINHHVQDKWIRIIRLL
ncbi:hypothetical protein HMPREF9372_3423 [Sporosarcina newyorkensis 2681]|uniref:Uncharacterized protein n=1 Tax=Sporosarcina newyorkensis 2681 TaxID=1027292 RepID=F9DX92_9BACL|nr:hypothetical protein HMPREF9372_3423 [Sporosarcina newyorkensis 2681]